MTGSTTSTLSRFPAAAADFVRDLYVEHLEEASFLYDQRNYLLEHVEAEAADIAWNEQRCDRHLDALVARGDSTFSMCRERAASGEDAGEIYAAMRVFCRAERPDLVKTVLDELDTDDAERVTAARDGLKHELPRSWSAQVSRWLDEADEPRAALLAVASAHRGLDAGPAIVLNASGVPTAAVPFLWALGRMRERTGTLLFQKCLQEGDDESRRAAAIAALRCGDEPMAPCLRQAVARGETWAAVPLSLLGELSDFGTLERLAGTGGPDAELALALGLLGHLGAVDILLRWLDVDDIALTAATAMHLLTGAYPVEEVPEAKLPVEESAGGEGNDDATGNETAAREGGSTNVRLSQSRPTWEAWWTDHCRDLDMGERARFGGVASPAAALRGLLLPRLPLSVRNLLGDGLAVRHGVAVPPADDWNLKAQVAGLTAPLQVTDRKEPL